jgi:phosphohistidine phosphatase
MELILLRHGKAEDFNAGGDAARVLVAKGHDQAKRAAKLLRVLDCRPHVVLTSPRARARETAETFCTAAMMPGPVMQSWLDCGMDPETALMELKAFSDFERVMIVGHEPDFSALVTWLLGCDGSDVEVKKGSLIGIEVQPPSKQSVLQFVIPPKMIGEF